VMPEQVEGEMNYYAARQREFDEKYAGMTTREVIDAMRAEMVGDFLKKFPDNPWVGLMAEQQAAKSAAVRAWVDEKVAESREVCDCECDADPNDPDEDGTEGNEPWHYLRSCGACGHQWYGLHCPHDGYQNPCPECGTRPTPVRSE
jgi:hypothetical protein